MDLLSSMPLPAVTVGIPTRNRLTLLERAITSVHCQTYPNIHIIVSDNASSDGTAELCKSLSTNLDNLAYYRHDQLISASDNFYSLVARSASNYIFILADDDWLHPRAIEQMVKSALTDSAIVAVTSFSQECTVSGIPTMTHTYPGLRSTYSLFQLLYLLNPFCQHLYGAAVYALLTKSMAKKLFPRKPLRSLSGRHLLTGDEIPFLLEIVCSGHFTVCQEPLFYYSGPIGRDESSASLATLVSRNLSTLDLFSFYLFSWWRNSKIVLNSNRFNIFLRFFFLIYSFASYLAFMLVKVFSKLIRIRSGSFRSCQ